MFILFIVKYDSDEEMSIEQLMTGGDNPELFDRIYNNDNYKKAFKLWVPFLDKRGYLDTLISHDEPKVAEAKVEVPEVEVPKVEVPKVDETAAVSTTVTVEA